ncbi:MAG: T9SS type A sorting domain-containing protein [Bacteroidales bacterium]|nr:T9SS type A sorting domain-containing protein [Candidatus Scybalousia scybalohippi]
MKKLTLFVLSLGLMFGAFAQKTAPQSANRFERVAPITKVVKANAAKDVTATMSDVTVTPDGGKFLASVDVTMGGDAAYIYWAAYQAGALESYCQQQGITPADYFQSGIQQYIDAGYGVDVLAAYGLLSTETSVTFQGFWGNSEYTMYAYVVNADATEGTVASSTFSTPSSSMNGVAEVSVNYTVIPGGQIEWDVTPNNQTAEFWFVCEPNDEDNALYWYASGDASTEEESYMMDLQYWATHEQYSDYFTFDANADVNEVFAMNMFAEDGEYVNGDEYVWTAAGFNGNGEVGEFVYAVFTYGQVSLNDAENVTVSVYPNPASEYVSVSSANVINNVELYNTLGQVVYAKEVKANAFNVPVAELANGTYFVKAYTANGVATSKVVVR